MTTHYLFIWSSVWNSAMGKRHPSQ